MQEFELDPTCAACSVRLLDTEDELVCPICGATSEKVVVETPAAGNPRPQDSVRVPLGSYMGSREPSSEERASRGITGAGSKYEYLKLVSDFAGRDEGSAVACARLIERVGEKLSLPRVVSLEAARTASRLLSTIQPDRRITVAAVSAYSLISASRSAGVTTASMREIIDAHLVLGRRLSLSSIIWLSLESPVRTYASGPEEYVTRILARLANSRAFSDKLSRQGVRLAGYLKMLRETGKELFKLVDTTDLLGKKPQAVAASAIYSAEVVLSTCESRNRWITQREAAECGDVSEYTVRDQCAGIFKAAVGTLLARKKRSLPPPPAR